MIEVIKPGMYTSIQDQGRFGYRKFGVPVSGAMDFISARNGNKMVGNPINTSVIEFAHIGPTLRFKAACFACISGADFKISLDNQPISVNQLFKIESNQELKIENCTVGVYGYLCIQGDWNVEKVMNSTCQYHNITAQTKLAKGDMVSIINKGQIKEASRLEIAHETFNSTIIEVEEGPEFHIIASSKQDFFNQTISVTNDCNRMGYRLEGSLGFTANEILTSPVQPGTVQLTPGGQLIALMRDAQTSGGYARILQITPESINRLAQMRPGKRFKFKFIQ